MYKDKKIEVDEACFMHLFLKAEDQYFQHFFHDCELCSAQGPQIKIRIMANCHIYMDEMSMNMHCFFQ